MREKIKYKMVNAEKTNKRFESFEKGLCEKMDSGFLVSAVIRDLDGEDVKIDCIMISFHTDSYINKR